MRTKKISLRKGIKKKNKAYSCTSPEHSHWHFTSMAQHETMEIFAFSRTRFFLPLIFPVTFETLFSNFSNFNIQEFKFRDLTSTCARKQMNISTTCSVWKYILLVLSLLPASCHQGPWFPCWRKWGIIYHFSASPCHS